MTLFKRNYAHVFPEQYFKMYRTVSRGNPNYFITYGNGKSAARVQSGLRPNGAHRWFNYYRAPKCAIRPTQQRVATWLSCSRAYSCEHSAAGQGVPTGTASLCSSLEAQGASRLALKYMIVMFFALREAT